MSEGETILKNTDRPGSDGYRLIVKNEKTGEVEIEFETDGGFFVCGDKKGLVGTYQAVFGSTVGIAISVAKSEAVIKQMLKQSPPHLAEAVRKACAMIGKVV